MKKLTGFAVVLLIALSACDDDGEAMVTPDGGPLGDAAGTGGTGGTGGAGGGAKPFSTTIARGRPLSGLSAADRQQLCDAGEKWATEVLEKGDFKKASCRLAGYVTAAFNSEGATDAELRAACEQGYNECLIEEEEDMESPADATCEIPATCNITIEELELCLNDYVGVIQTQFEMIPACSAIKQSDFSEETTDMEMEEEEVPPPPSCVAAEARCPGLLE